MVDSELFLFSWIPLWVSLSVLRVTLSFNWSLAFFLNLQKWHACLGEGGPGERAIKQPGAEQGALEWESRDQGVLLDVSLWPWASHFSVLWASVAFIVWWNGLWFLQQTWVLTRMLWSVLHGCLGHFHLTVNLAGLEGWGRSVILKYTPEGFPGSLWHGRFLTFLLYWYICSLLSFLKFNYIYLFCVCAGEGAHLEVKGRLELVLYFHPVVWLGLFILVVISWFFVGSWDGLIAKAGLELTT